MHKEGYLPSYNEKFVSLFPDIDRYQIGTRLGEGMNHLVYAYGDSQVIKIPKRRAWHDHRTPEEKKEELAVINSVFPEYAVEAEVLGSPTTQHYLVLQRRLIHLENISPQNMGEVGDQLQELLKRNREMIRRQGLSLDLLGKDGAINTVKSRFFSGATPQISNVVLERTQDSPRISITDFSLLRISRDANPRTQNGVRAYVTSHITYEVNKRLIKKGFGIDITPKG